MSSYQENSQSGDPLVSVVTPTFNSIKYVARVIECVNKQTLSSVEHIIVDDGSTDGTLERLKLFEKQMPWLKLLSQKNSGAGAARNAGIQLASGRYIAFLDSDDCWAAGKLEAQICFMTSSSVEFSYGDYSAIDVDSGQVVASYTPPESLTYADLLHGCPIGCLTVAYDQGALGKVYMPLVRRGQDWGLWLALTRNGLVARKYPGNLASYSLSSKSLSRNKIKKMSDVYRIYVKKEKIGRVRAISFLFLHLISSFRKSWLKVKY